RPARPPRARLRPGGRGRLARRVRRPGPRRARAARPPDLAPPPRRPAGAVRAGGRAGGRVAGRGFARAGPGGGGEIQAARRLGPGVGTALATLAAAAAVGAYAPLLAGRFERPLAVPGALALLLLSVALL